MIKVGNHYRRTDEARDSTVYRVVGATEEVTLLRVTDANGRRAHTGEIRHVSRGTLETKFEPAENPDAGFSPISVVENMLQGIYWQFHMYLWSPLLRVFEALTTLFERLRRR